MLNSHTYATAALELAREGRWSVAYWLLERAVRAAPVHLLEEYLQLMIRARALAAKDMLLMTRPMGLA
jgi:hypothetical protein